MKRANTKMAAHSFSSFCGWVSELAVSGRFGMNNPSGRPGWFGGRKPGLVLIGIVNNQQQIILSFFQWAMAGTVVWKKGCTAPFVRQRNDYQDKKQVAGAEKVISCPPGFQQYS